MTDHPDQTPSGNHVTRPFTKPGRFLYWYSIVLIGLSSLFMTGMLMFGVYDLAHGDIGVAEVLIVSLVLFASGIGFDCFCVPQFFSVFRRSLRAAIWTFWIFRVGAFVAVCTVAIGLICGLLFSDYYYEVAVIHAVVFGLVSLNVRQQRSWIATLYAAGTANLASQEAELRTNGEPVLQLPLLLKRLMIWPAAIILVVLVIPGYQIVIYNLTVPTPKTNYLADYNKKVMETPESERAWTHYKKILGQDVTYDNRKDLDWPTQSKLLIEVRRASEYKDLGFLLSDGSTSPVARPADATDSNEYPLFPLFLYMNASPANELVQHAVYLDKEAAVSVSKGDWELATVDIIAMLNIAEQLDDIPIPLFMMSSYIAGRRALERVLICMMHQSSGFSTDQLTRLEERIKKYQLQKFQSGFAGEHWMLADMRQRAFVVTESGDGYLHLPSLWAWDERERKEGWEYLVAPFVAKRKFCTLSQHEQQHSRLMQIAERDFSQPAWQLGHSTHLAAVLELMEDEKFKFFASLILDLAPVYVIAEQAYETADVVLLIIAARRYAIEHGDWPTDLRDLVPQYLERIPRNRFDGKQYRSKLKDGLLTVYSFGFDGDDDQGRRRLPVESVSYDSRDVKPRVYRLDFKPYRVERYSIADDWRDRIFGLEVQRDDGDIVHFQELPPIPAGANAPSKID